MSEMWGDKGAKHNQVESRIGHLKIERDQKYCPACEQGFFSLDEQLKIWEKHWNEQVAKQAVCLGGLVPYGRASEIL
jgi:hypothetical protein